tara:strand:- start:24775 stop:24888 length:114 start_codon:yes stop_codon:yes gene_type:complete
MDAFARVITRARNKAAGLDEMLAELVEEYVEGFEGMG